MDYEMNNRPAPIALFVYNRPNLVCRTLESLARNAESTESRLYIFCDGPKADADESEKNRIIEVREIIRSKRWCAEVIIIESSTNKGLARSIIDGVTKVVNEWGRVIVLEDDLTFSPYFLKFMNEGLEMYAQEQRVLAVHGYLYPLQLPPKLKTKSFFIHDPGSLGWGTWKRAWDLFDSDTRKLYDLIRQRGLKEPFTFWGGYPFLRTLRQQMAGKVDSWAIRWRAIAYLHDRLTLYPTVSLVNHEGNVPEATHHYMQEGDFTYTKVSDLPVELEKEIVENNEAIEHIFGRFLKKHAGMSLAAKVRRRVRLFFHIK